MVTKTFAKNKTSTFRFLIKLINERLVMFVNEKKEKYYYNIMLPLIKSLKIERIRNKLI